MFTLLKWSSQSSSAADNVISPPSSPVSALGTIIWEASEKNLSVKWDSPELSSDSLNFNFRQDLAFPILYTCWSSVFFLDCLTHLLSASFSCLGSVRNSHYSLTHLLLFLWIGMDQSWASRSYLERPASCARALCLGMVPPRKSSCQFPEKAELCFHVQQDGDVAADSHLLGTCILPPYNHCSFHHKTAFVFLIISALPIFSIGLWINYPYQFWKFLDCLCRAMFSSKH